MSKLHTNHLALSWSISKGRNTYGYNICRLDSHDSGKRYRCMGGGYDMTGTVVADWLVAEHQDKLQALICTLELAPVNNYTQPFSGYLTASGLYGLTVRPDGSVTVDGACGIECVIRIAEACGIELQRLNNRKCYTIGFIASWEA